nr:xylulose kinase-1 [Tanacetum cinerariifolium]
MRTRSQPRNNFTQQEASPVIVKPLRIELPFLEDQFQEDPPLEVPMADNQTLAELLQAPNEGYEDAIVIPEIAANNFEFKHDLINLVQNKQFFRHDKEDPHAHIRYFNKITSTMRVPNDSLNSAAGGNFLDKMPRECLKIIESKSKDMVKALLIDKKNQSSAPAPSPTPAPAPVKAVELNYVTCGDNDGNIKMRPPVTAEKYQQVQREEKAKTILLFALPDEHMGDFYHMIDARDIWNVIKARFGRNAESKKMQKSLLKQKFKEFKIFEEEGLDKGYDKMQKILTQMNTLKIKPEQEDVNMKFLRGLPLSWSASPVIVEPLWIELPFLEDQFQEDPPPDVPMADNQTMAESLQAPTEGYEDAIVIPEITANNFELKHGLINLVQNK